MNILPFRLRAYRQLAVGMLFFMLVGSGLMGLMPRHSAAGVVCSNCITIDKPVYNVGDKFSASLKNMAPNTSIFATAKLNSAVLIENLDTGLTTDANGTYVLDAGIITDDAIGVWNVTVEVGNQQASLSFTINPAPGDNKPALNFLARNNKPVLNNLLTANQGAQGETVTLYLEGKNLSAASSISGNGISPVSDRGFQFVSSQVLSNFEIQATYTIAANSEPGTRHITVTTPSGTTNAQDFTITPPAPVVTSVSPSPADLGTKIQISGSKFSEEPIYINLYPPGEASTVFGDIATRISDTQLEYTLPTSGLSPGNYDLTLSINGTSASYYFLESNKVPLTVTGTPIDLLPPVVVLPVNSQDGEVLQFNSEPALYLVKPDGLHPFESYYAFQLYAGQNDKTVRRIAAPSGNFTVSDVTAAQYLYLLTGEGQPFVPGTLVNFKGTIFLIMVGKQIPFRDMKAFTGLGYSLKNVINADLSSYSLTQTVGIKSSAVPHTWGSWISYKGTIYYSDETGLIGVPTYDIFLNNRGMLSMVLPANKYDIVAINKSSTLPLLDYFDSRVEYSVSSPVVLPPLSPVSSDAQARDDQRLADVRLLAAVLELYYNDKGKYPAALSDVLTTAYLSQVPVAPVPADGTCSDSQNTYAYTQQQSGASYQLLFCLGGSTGGLSSGVRILNPGGFQ